LIEAAPFSHPIIRWLVRGVPVALMDLDQVNEWEPHAPVVLDAASGELRAWDAPTVSKPWDPPTAPSLGQPLRIADGTEIRLCARVADQPGVRRAVANGADSIGLVRSEHLVPEDACRPTTDFFRCVFSKLLTLAEPLSVAIRLLDLAAYKRPAWLPHTCDEFSVRDLPGSQQRGISLGGH